MEIFRGGPRRQLGAALRWNSYRRLHRISVPTLVMHGVHDRLIPVVNARLLARLIPTARLVPQPRAGHFFITDAAAEAAAATDGFLGDVEAGRVASLPRRERLRAIIATASERLAVPAGPSPALVTRLAR